MGRLIEAETLMKEMYHRAFETDGDTMWQSGCWVRYRAVEQTVGEQPTVDAVPVVRCKDCAHNNLPPTAGNALCSIYYGMTEVYGFCHRGERREE